MLELWRRRETLTADGSAQAYLFQATRNRVLNHLRHLKIEQRTEPDVRGASSSTPHADAAVVEEELDVAVQRAVQSLPDRCREVFEERFVAERMARDYLAIYEDLVADADRGCLEAMTA